MSPKIGVESHNFKMPINYEWLRFVANDSAIKTQDVLEIFDISSAGLYWRISAGNFPKPDFFYENRKGYNKVRYPKNLSFWKKETIINEIRRLQGLKIKP